MNILRLKNKATSLIELVVALVISAVLLLMIGAVPSIGIGTGQKAYDDYRKETQVYNDIVYGLGLIKNRVRHAQDVVKVVTPSPSWKNWTGQILVVDDRAFGLYIPAGHQNPDFLYSQVDPNNDNSKPVIINTILDNIESANLSFDRNGSEVTIRIWGSKDKENFDLTAKVTRRN